MAHLLAFDRSTTRRSLRSSAIFTATSFTPSPRPLRGRLVDKLQRLLLKRPDTVDAVEQLIDDVLAETKDQP